MKSLVRKYLESTVCVCFTPSNKSVNSDFDKSLILCAGFFGTTSVCPSKRGNTSRKAPQFSPRPTKLPGMSPDSIFWNSVDSAMDLADSIPLKVLRVVFALKHRVRVSNFLRYPYGLLMSKCCRRCQQVCGESARSQILRSRTFDGYHGFLCVILRFERLLWQV